MLHEAISKGTRARSGSPTLLIGAAAGVNPLAHSASESFSGREKEETAKLDERVQIFDCLTGVGYACSTERLIDVALGNRAAVFSDEEQVDDAIAHAAPAR